MPSEIRAAVERANLDSDVRVIVLCGNGRAFCAGYDLKLFAESKSFAVQKMPWNPFDDYVVMRHWTECFMSLWNSHKPTIAKVHGPAVAGGSDIALCCDMILMADEARIGYPAARLWGSPTTAMWVYRLGPEKAKRMLFTGDVISGTEAAAMGLVLKSVPRVQLDAAVKALTDRMITVPTNQMFFHKQV